MKTKWIDLDKFRLVVIKKYLQDNMMKRIAMNSGIVLSGNLISTALNIIAFAVMARSLGPELLAMLVLSQTYALIINDMFNIQTWESMVKFGSMKSEKTAHVLKTNVFLDIVSAVAAFMIALFLARSVVHILSWDDSLIQIVKLYSISILFNITTLTIGVPRLFNKFFAIARINVVMAFLKLVGVLCAMYFSKPLYFYILIFLLVDILRNLSLIVLGLVLINHNFDRDWWKNKFIINKDQLKFIWWTNLRTIIRIPVRHFDMIIISSVMPMRTVGLYKVYKEIAGLLTKIADPVSQAIYPEFTKLLGRKAIKEATNVIKQTILLLSVLSAFLTLFLLTFSSFIVGKLFGTEYLVQINALYAMLLLYGAKMVTSPINSLFIASGFAKASFMIVLLTNSFYALFALYLGKILGIYGIILAFAFQSFLNTGLKIYLLDKYSGDLGNVIR